MIISDLSVRRPVFAAVVSLLLIAFGLIAFERLPLRRGSQKRSYVNATAHGDRQ